MEPVLNKNQIFTNISLTDMARTMTKAIDADIKLQIHNL
jgi:hypothetical protein